MAGQGGSGATGILGVIIGAILVVVIAVFVLDYAGVIKVAPQRPVDVNVTAPDKAK